MRISSSNSTPNKLICKLFSFKELIFARHSVSKQIILFHVLVWFCWCEILSVIISFRWLWENYGLNTKRSFLHHLICEMHSTLHPLFNCLHLERLFVDINHFRYKYIKFQNFLETKKNQKNYAKEIHSSAHVRS